jgi:cell division protein ZapA (FtsZ GTPase activity inhibitor)
MSEKQTIEAIIDGKRLTIKVEHDLAIAHQAIDMVQKQITEIKESSYAPMKREDLYLITAMNLAGELIKAMNKTSAYEQEFDLELKKIDQAIKKN